MRMAQIFLSYAREDKKAAEFYAKALESEGYSVWWDHKIIPGLSFNKAIEERLNACSCMVVLWSHNSINSNYVNDEATVAHESEKLVSALIDDTPTEAISFPFNARHIAKMPNWEQGKLSGEWDSLLSAITHLCGSPKNTTYSFDPDALRAKGLTEFPGSEGPTEEPVYPAHRLNGQHGNLRAFAAPAVGASLALIIIALLFAVLIRDNDEKSIAEISGDSQSSKTFDTASTTIDSDTKGAAEQIPTKELPGGSLALSDDWLIVGETVSFADAQKDFRGQQAFPLSEDCEIFASSLVDDTLFKKLSSEGLQPAVWATTGKALRICEFRREEGVIRFDVRGQSSALQGRAAWMLKQWQ